MEYKSYPTNYYPLYSCLRISLCQIQLNSQDIFEMTFSNAAPPCHTPPPGIGNRKNTSYTPPPLPTASVAVAVAFQVTSVYGPDWGRGHPNLPGKTPKIP